VQVEQGPEAEPESQRGAGTVGGGVAAWIGSVAGLSAVDEGGEKADREEQETKGDREDDTNQGDMDAKAVADSKVVFSGELRVMAPKGEQGWEQCMQSMKIMMDEGRIVIVGSKRQELRSPAQAADATVDDGLYQVFEELVRTLGAEWFAVRKINRPGQVDQEKVREIARRAVAHITTSVGMRVVAQHRDLLSMYQPTFAICVCNGQVRLMTLAFVGTPSNPGSPMEQRRTPFLLRLLTSDLSTEVETTTYVVRDVADSVKCTKDYLASIDPALFLVPAKTDAPARRAKVAFC